MTKKELIANLLESNSTLVNFVKAFHDHLVETNPGRMVGKDRTAHEKALDSMGRLLVGDEVCAAVALDEKWLVSTNRNYHVTSEVSIRRWRQTIAMREDGELADITTTYLIVAESNDGRRKRISQTCIDEWRYDSENKRFNPSNERLSFSVQPDEHGITEYDDVISCEITQGPLLLYEGIARRIRPDAQINTFPNEVIFRSPLDPFQRRAGTLFFHMMQMANFVEKGDQATMSSGERISRYETVRRHRARLMLQTFFWNAASWYPVFKGTKKRKGFNLDACQPTHRNLDIFLALLPDSQLDRVNRGEVTREEVIGSVRRYTRRLVQEVLASGMSLDEWCTNTQTSVEHCRGGVPEFIFDAASAKFFFDRFKKYFIACERLKELQRYIEKLSEQCNAALKDNPGKPPITLINDWVLKLHAILLKPGASRAVEECPDFLRAKSKCSLHDFFERFSKYFIDILRVETYVKRKAESSARADINFTTRLLDLHSYENSQAHGLFVPKIIDKLADGSHAEIRLFYYLTQVLRRDVHSIPYFGITQLCCANCRTFLSGHGLTHEEGHRHHAGIHGKHYPDWVLDDLMCNEANLRALFGPSYEQYTALTEEYTFEGETKTLQEWARIIVQELGVLDKTLMEKFGIPGEPLFPRGSNYADEDFEPPDPLAIDELYVALPGLGITRQFIQGDGACQFRAVHSALILFHIADADGPALMAPSEDGVNALRQGVTEYIAREENRERFSAALAEYTAGGHTHQDIAYTSLDHYLEEMTKPTTYGDHLSLQSLAEITSRSIVVIRPTVDAVNPVGINIICPTEDTVFNIDEALILIFNGFDHYDVASTRGNAIFHSMVVRANAPPEQHRAATVIQALFRGCLIRGPAPEDEPAIIGGLQNTP